MIDTVVIIALLSLFAFHVTRSPIGQRNKSEVWPAWVEKIGARDVPRVVRAGWFTWLAWLSRRLLPVVTTLFAWEVDNYLTDTPPRFGLTALDWLAILSLLLAILCGAYPFYLDLVEARSISGSPSLSRRCIYSAV